MTVQGSPEQCGGAAERSDAQLTGQRLIASVQLVKALGGGWVAPPLPAKGSLADATKIAQNGK